MNEAHLHLLVNHVPIIGGAFASLALAWGVIRNNKAIMNMAMVFFVLLAVASMVADITGEGAEEVLEHSSTVFNHDAIEAHEEAAFPANIAMLLTGLVALVTLIVRKLREGRIFPILVLALSLVAFGLMVRAGSLGGDIVHVEANSAPNAGGGEHDDD